MTASRWPARGGRPAGPAAGADQQDRPGSDGSRELRQALLPADLPVLPRARLAARCLLAANGQAGGDWFDAIPRADGTVALMVGTVPGDGIDAAAGMSRLRAVFDELLTTEADLETALGRADAFAARSPALRSATLVLAVLNPEDGALRYASFGHPPPLIAGTGPAAARYLSGAGTGPLGTGGQLALAVDVLQPGQLLLLYSDGLIERPARNLTQSLAELADAAASAVSGGGGRRNCSHRPGVPPCRSRAHSYYLRPRLRRAGRAAARRGRAAAGPQPSRRTRQRDPDTAGHRPVAQRNRRRDRRPRRSAAGRGRDCRQRRRACLPRRASGPHRDRGSPAPGRERGVPDRRLRQLEHAGSRTLRPRTRPDGRGPGS